eukprot:8751694-Pyramimonas_sp.AAC.1
MTVRPPAPLCIQPHPGSFPHRERGAGESDHHGDSDCGEVPAGECHSPDFAVATWSDGDSWSAPQVSSENTQLASASGKTKSPNTSPDWIKAKDGK